MKNNIFEALALHIVSMLKTSALDYCDLETVDGKENIVANDGSYISIAKLDGARNIVGREQFNEFISHLTLGMSTFYRRRGHQLQVVFRVDDDTNEDLTQTRELKNRVANTLELDIHHLIDEDAKKMEEYTHDEDCLFVFWTRPAILDKNELKHSSEENKEYREEKRFPYATNAQNLLAPITSLREEHNTFVDQVCTSINNSSIGCFIEVLDVQQALKKIRRTIYPEYTPSSWKALIPEEPQSEGIGRPPKIAVRWKEGADMQDASEALYPTLPQQIMVADAEIGSTKSDTNKKKNLPDTCIRVGQRYYAPIVFLAPPSEPQFFKSLMDFMRDNESGTGRITPFSFSFLVDADGMSMMRFRTVFANLLALTSERNRNIAAASKALSEWSRDGGTVTKTRMMAMTWAPATEDGLQLLERRKAKLWRALESWGAPRVSENSGDPMQAFQGCIAGLSSSSIGSPAPIPMEDVLSLMPLVRPASPFEHGTIFYRSLDGKLLRYQKFSSEQTTWITLLAGKPGSGKSVLMNHNNVESCLTPGLKKLPWIGIIDIGISSKGFTDLIEESLPDDKKHLVLYKRLQNDERDCINPMDTPLGQRYPLPKAKEFIKNFVTALVTAPEREGIAIEGMSNFVGRVIDAAYALRDEKQEKSSAQKYSPGHNKFLDESVEKIRALLKYPDNVTYWELVDVFFQQEMYYAAEVAQRYAVPTMRDLISVANNPDGLGAEYGEVIIEGRKLVETFIIGVSEAVSAYPVFSHHTRFDVGSARIMSIDLQDVAIQGDASSHKTTSLMYMMARQLFMKKVAFSREDLPFISNMYKKYFEQIIDDLIDEYKILCMDEYHKTGGHPSLINQVITDGREARKWNMELILASQMMEDFGRICSFATSIFVLDSGTAETRKWLKENIGFNDVEMEALAQNVHGAGRHGATFMGRFTTKSSTYTQLFTATIGPARLWSLSTTAEDRKLRTLLYKALPHGTALKLLAQKFPSGSCKAYVERMRQSITGGKAFEDDVEDGVIGQLAKDIMAESAAQL